MIAKQRFNPGQLNVSVLTIVGLAIVSVAFAGFAIWAFANYQEQKRDVDEKIDQAVNQAVLENSKQLQADFEKANNATTTQFIGPANYGSLRFDYPRSWSVYEASDISRGGGVTYEAYLNPKQVPPVVKGQKFALRVTIEQKLYEDIIASYDKLIEKGELKSSVFSHGGTTGTKLVGNFDKDTYATAVLIKMRDRTLTLRTDGNNLTDIYNEILKTISFNE